MRLPRWLLDRPIAHLVLWSLGLAKAETQTTEAERDCLARHAAGKRNLAEIGIWHGVTTCRLRKAMDPNGILVAIDPYPLGRLGFNAQRPIAHAEVSKIHRGTVKWIRKTGSNAAQEMRSHDGSRFDFVFIDGDHSFQVLQADWEGWSPIISGGGIIALHDSRSTAERQIESAGSVRFTRDVIERDDRFHIIEVVDSLTVLQRHPFDEL